VPLARFTLQIAWSCRQAIDIDETPRGNAELPAAAAGDEKADEEVVLRMRIDVLRTEHGYLT
jgi:hypothetical protein